MSKLSAPDVLPFLVMITILLGAARLLGELFRKIHSAAVIGELIAGILLGPSLIGRLFPDFYQMVFTDPKNSAMAFDGLSRIAIIFLMFVAGMEVNLENIKRRGKAAAKISLGGIIFPLVIGFAATWFFYDRFFSVPTDNKLMPALFMGTALSITALTMLAKILIDTALIKTRFGNLMLTAAMLNDFAGWILFSLVISMANLSNDRSLNMVEVLVLIFLFTVLLLTVGTKLVDNGFYLANRYFSKPASELSLSIIVCFLGAIFTEWIGIHAIFGSFLVGVAVGASKNFTANSREKLHDIMTSIFAPLFFVSIGLQVDIIKNFDFQVVFLILLISITGKVLGGYIGARLSGFKKNKALAMGFGMNARGSQTIILGLIALQAQIIDERVFTGLIVMTIVTVIASGPAIKYFLRRHEQSMELSPRPGFATDLNPTIPSGTEF
jgi:Kef-type K+ transport system membrane component KefB